MSKDIQKILTHMKQPTQLLKFGMSGKPKFTSFILSNDHASIAWTSQKKDASQTRVLIRNIKDFKFGQRTEKFKRNPRPDLQHLSFSIIYSIDSNDENIETLDICCKDDKEFEIWTSGILALIDAADTTNTLAKTNLLQQTPLIGGVNRETVTNNNNLLNVASSRNRANSGAGDGDDAKQAFQESNDCYSCGWGDWGQGGLAEKVNARTPIIVKCLLGKGVKQLACGWSHSGVELETGQYAMLGNRIGTGNMKDTMLPLMISMPFRSSIKAIACGSYHSAVLNDMGQLYTWGCNNSGQLGLGHFNDVVTPTLVVSWGDSASSINLVNCGATSTAVVDDNGTIYTWGSGEHGQLGHNDLKNRNIPTIVQDLQGTRIVRLAIGEAHMLATSDDEFFVWGWNACGQLGLGHTEDVIRPSTLEVLGRQKVSSVSAGAAHSVAIVWVQKVQARVLYAWGSNSSGQLGISDKKGIIMKPTVVTTNEDITDLSCGSHHTVLLTVNGEIMSSGSNEFGQLGNGEMTSDQNEFKIIESMRGRMIRAVCCGGGNTLMLVARAWVADSEAKDCMACKSPFTMLNRRHHCRNCGGIFCNSCSSKKAAILKYGVVEPVRVCGSCYTKITGQR